MRARWQFQIVVGFAIAIGPRAGGDGGRAGSGAELFELAAEIASAIPADPHGNDRARAKQAVVEACLKLNEVDRASALAAQIGNWRRGTAYAAIAMHHAQLDDPAAARRCLDLAAASAAQATDWRRDRINAHIAMVRACLGEQEPAARLEGELATAEAGKVEIGRAARAGADDLDAQLAALDRLMATGDFDTMRNAIEACLLLADRFYDDAARRSLVDKRLEAALGELPPAVRLDALIKQADTAVKHGDGPRALRFVDEARGVLDGHGWTPEHAIPQRARLGALRYRAGEPEPGGRDVEAALAQFQAQRESIMSIDRADALLGVAEAIQAIGEPARAGALYARCVEESIVSPNARPRAIDLSAICCSMAVHGAAPDAALLTRIRQLSEALGPPW